MSCHVSAVINAPINTVWARIRNFHDMTWAAGLIETCEKVGEAAGNQIGAKRLLNGLFNETLLAIDEVSMSFRYSIDDAPGAPVAAGSVTDYRGHVQLHPITQNDTTLSTWTSAWADSDGGVKAFCDPIYGAAVSALQAQYV